jgi:predicted nucleic acid-binding protein
LYPGFKGKLGITDTSSVAVMRKFRVKEIFSPDGDFDSVLGVRRKEQNWMRADH